MNFYVPLTGEMIEECCKGLVLRADLGESLESITAGQEAWEVLQAVLLQTNTVNFSSEEARRSYQLGHNAGVARYKKVMEEKQLKRAKKKPLN